MIDNIKISSGKGFKFITNFVIHDTTEQRIILDFKYVPRKDGSLHHIVLEVIKLTKLPSQTWDQAQEYKTILSTDEPNKSLNKLVDALKAQRGLYERSNSDVVILEPKEANLFKQIQNTDLEFVTKILQSFKSAEAKELLSKVKQEDLDSLYFSVKHIKIKKSLVELEALIKDKVNEQGFQNWISDNAWVFGTEYIRKLETRKIGIHSEADFIVQSLDGYTDLVELKKSEFTLFEKDESHNCYYPSKELSKVIGQAIHYIKVMEDHHSILKEEDDMDVLKPRVKIVIGRSSTLGVEEKKALRLLNATLHGIEILTYDEVVSRARKIISIYEEE